jgi:hypothetical protein
MIRSGFRDKELNAEAASSSPSLYPLSLFSVGWVERSETQQTTIISSHIVTSRLKKHLLGLAITF